MIKSILVDSNKCTGCLSCVLSCSFAHTNKFSMQSRINIKKIKREGRCEIYVCRQCNDAQCISVCPTGALKKDSVSGEVVFDSENCIGCKLCISACPYNAITFLDEKNIIEKCDLCGGDPICAKVCTTGALTFIETE
ncbi:MAG: 4Fe-4S dicluster domain-containing protein [Tissierellales bacterium]|nr:4Fe-4S dicluster domain-containing protein [Tissierellales bacterium]